MYTIPEESLSNARTIYYYYFDRRSVTHEGLDCSSNINNL